jgi:protein required for attachment to host cells
MQWLIVADAGSARFFEMNDDNGTLTEKLNLVHPEARLKAGDVYEGDVGRKSGASMSPHTQRQDVEDDQFARLVAAEAKKLGDACDRLHLAAPPRFLGHLRKRLDKTVERKVAGTLSKDLTHLSAHELQKALST